MALIQLTAELFHPPNHARMHVTARTQMPPCLAAPDVARETMPLVPLRQVVWTYV